MKAIEVENLGKRYFIPSSTKRGGFGPFVRSIPGWIRGREPLILRSNKREFWALREVTFNVEPGKILGIIGPNGAGKSTLLKIIARIILPTEGRASGTGRVVSLLELGAGFNPEAPVLENIYMNAALYGVSRAEVNKHIEEIIRFAEIDEFRETPLKFYSSGMYLRLAFSVAVNMQPSVLVADEILAVGDQVFQERCLKRVTELAEKGLTVLFVSHDMDAILKVSDEVMFLNEGRMARLGNPEEVVDEYRSSAWARSNGPQGRHVNKFAELIGARLVSREGKEIGSPAISEEVFVRIRLSVTRAPIEISCGFDLYKGNALIFRSVDPTLHKINEPGVYDAWACVPREFLAELLYTVHAFVLLEHEGKQTSLIIYRALSFMPYSTVSIEKQRLLKNAMLAPRFEWKLEKESEVVST